MTLIRDRKYQKSFMSFPILPHLLSAHRGNDLDIGENSLHALTKSQPDMARCR